MSDKQLEHDIKSALSSARTGIELACDEWQKNSELVERILPLINQKLLEIDLLMKEYKKEK